MIELIGFVTVIAALAALYLVASPRFGERAYHSALFAPWKYPIGAYDGELVRSTKFEDIFFTAVDGSKLHGWFFQGTKPQTIILNHGKTGNITDVERLMFLLLETGASIFIYDYRGFGRSEGSPSLKVICEDGISAYKWCTETRKIPAENLVAYGESLGGLVACHQAENTQIAGLILQSAFSSLRQISIENVGALRVFPESLFPDSGKNTVTLQSFENPVLIIHGALDQDIVIDHSHRLHAAAKGKKEMVVLPNTEHDEISRHDSETFVQSVTNFLSQLDQRKNAVIESTSNTAIRHQ